MNAAHKIVYDFNMKRFEAFKAQDSETGDFDVVFEIAGKKLYANKFMLCPISTTFKSMLSDRWSKHGEPVKIEEYTFDDFKDFLAFIYSGECQLTNDNIFAMIDMAEFFGIEAFKGVCETYLLGMLNLENVYQMIELVDKYTMDQFRKSLNSFISSNLVKFCKSPQFQYLQKLNVKDFVEANQETSKQEEMFEAVFEWAKYQANKKQKLDQSLDLNVTMKGEIAEFLPLIKFKKMEDSFLIKFVVGNSFLFSDDQLNEIVWARNKWFVKSIDGNEKLLKGELQCGDNENVANVIQSIKDQSCKYFHPNYYYWKTRQPKPSTPSKLIKNNKIEWYLVFDGAGDLAIKRRTQVKLCDYLLAEMSAENGFTMSKACKIEICSRF